MNERRLIGTPNPKPDGQHRPIITHTNLADAMSAYRGVSQRLYRLQLGAKRTFEHADQIELISFQ